MNHWINQHPLQFVGIILLLFAIFWTLLINVIALASGWKLLAKRFRAQQPFSGPVWKWQYAVFRRFCGYNGCLIAGADPMGLFLNVMLSFRPGHPPLFIPWTEITLPHRPWRPDEWVDFILGSNERIPFKIRGKLASRLQANAGTSWPLDKNETIGNSGRFGPDHKTPSSSRFVIR